MSLLSDTSEEGNYSLTSFKENLELILAGITNP